MAAQLVGLHLSLPAEFRLGLRGRGDPPASPSRLPHPEDLPSTHVGDEQGSGAPANPIRLSVAVLTTEDSQTPAVQMTLGTVSPTAATTEAGSQQPGGVPCALPSLDTAGNSASDTMAGCAGEQAALAPAASITHAIAQVAAAVVNSDTQPPHTTTDASAVAATVQQMHSTALKFLRGHQDANFAQVDLVHWTKCSTKARQVAIRWLRNAILNTQAHTESTIAQEGHPLGSIACSTATPQQMADALREAGCQSTGVVLVSNENVTNGIILGDVECEQNNAPSSTPCMGAAGMTFGLSAAQSQHGEIAKWHATLRSLDPDARRQSMLSLRRLAQQDNPKALTTRIED